MSKPSPYTPQPLYLFPNYNLKNKHSNLYYDVKYCFTGTEVYAHRSILAYESIFFEELFKKKALSWWPSSKIFGLTIDNDGYSVEVISAMVDSIYSEDIDDVFDYINPLIYCDMFKIYKDYKLYDYLDMFIDKYKKYLLEFIDDKLSPNDNDFLSISKCFEVFNRTHFDKIDNELLCKYRDMLNSTKLFFIKYIKEFMSSATYSYSTDSTKLYILEECVMGGKIKFDHE